MDGPLEAEEFELHRANSFSRLDSHSATKHLHFAKTFRQHQENGDRRSRVAGSFGLVVCCWAKHRDMAGTRRTSGRSIVPKIKLSGKITDYGLWPHNTAWRCQTGLASHAQDFSVHSPSSRPVIQP